MQIAVRLVRRVRLRLGPASWCVLRLRGGRATVGEVADLLDATAAAHEALALAEGDGASAGGAGGLAQGRATLVTTIQMFKPH